MDTSSIEILEMSWKHHGITHCQEIGNRAGTVMGIQ